MKTLSCSLLLVCLLLTGVHRASADDSIQGIWHGTGVDERYTLVFTGKVMVAMIGNHPLLETKQSGFQADCGEIDLERAEGTQRGLYTIENDTLTLTVAAVNEERPILIGEKPRATFRTYTFTRQR